MTTLTPFVSAAEVADYSKRVFIDVLGPYGVPVANYPAGELATEVAC